MSAPDTPPPSPAEAAAQVAGPPPMRVLRTLAWLLLTLVVALGVAAVGLVRSEAGLRWALAQVPGLQVQGLAGSAFGESLRIDHLTWRAPGPPDQALQVQVQGMELHRPRWTWRPAPGVWLALQAQAVRATRVDIRTGASTGRAPTLPASLRLPAELQIDRIELGELRLNDQPPLQQVQAALHLGAQGGSRHRVQALT